MKHKLSILLALALLLGGCAAPQDTQATVSPDRLAQFFDLHIEDPDLSYYVPGSVTELQTAGAFKFYLTDHADACELLSLGSGRLLLLSGDPTTLTVLEGESLLPAATYEAPCYLSSQDGSLHISESAIGFYDPASRTYTLLSHRLAQPRVITLPEDASGSAFLSSDETLLYYTAGTEIKALSLSLGVSHTLRQEEAALPGLQASLLDAQVLVYPEADSGRLVCIDAADGSRLGTLADTAPTYALGSRFLTEVQEADMRRLILSGPEGQLQEFDPGSKTGICIPLNGGVVTTLLRRNSTLVHYFDLEAGIRTGTASIASPMAILSAAREGDTLYLLCRSTESKLCRIYSWDLSRTTADGTRCLSPYYTADAPDAEGLAAVQAEADALGGKYGIRIALWEDALSLAPEGCGFTEEYLVDIYQRELGILDKLLASLPESFRASVLKGLTVSIVRQIQGSGTRCASERQVLPYWQGSHPHIAVATGKDFAESFLHGLGHILDSRILSTSNELDDWRSRNPSEFFYAYDYAAAPDAAWEGYTSGEQRCFVGLSATLHPQEDRAQLFAAAMGSDASVFRSDAMQEKLGALCAGIREGLLPKNYPDPLPWEAYLEK